MPEESTTPDALEVSRRAFEAINRGDLDAVLSTFAPDAVCDFSAWGIGTFEGRPAIRGFVEDWLGSYEEYRAEPEEMLDFGRGVVFVAYRERVRLAGSQGHLEWRRGYVALLRDGYAERAAWYTDADEARAAAERLAKERE
jgi:ketosteroid isomerase-like protein